LPASVSADSPASTFPTRFPAPDNALPISEKNPPDDEDDASGELIPLVEKNGDDPVSRLRLLGFVPELGTENMLLIEVNGSQLLDELLYPKLRVASGDNPIRPLSKSQGREVSLPAPVCRVSLV